MQTKSFPAYPFDAIARASPPDFPMHTDPKARRTIRLVRRKGDKRHPGAVAAHAAGVDTGEITGFSQALAPGKRKIGQGFKRKDVAAHGRGGH